MRILFLASHYFFVVIIVLEIKNFSLTYILLMNKENTRPKLNPKHRPSLKSEKEASRCVQ